jgi:AcrR family transcriptional regulator
VANLDATGEHSPHRVRIIDGALRCIARHGVSKTTVDDVARDAGISRATVYRVFPGGKDEVLRAVADTEVARLFAALGVRMGEADNLRDVLVGGIVECASRINTHEGLRYLLNFEPEVVLRNLAFPESDRLLLAASGFTAPFLARWMDMEEASRVAEWATRIVLSYAIAPSPGTDLTDPGDAERLIATFVIPGIEALHEAAPPTPIVITPFGTGPYAGASPTTDQPQHRKHSQNTEHDKGDRT